MVSEIYSNMVYFSDLLPKRCPKTFKGLIEVLEKYGVTYGLLKGTKDIWCRDYMPIQTIGNRFVLFRYEPDYLLDSNRHKATITDNTIAKRYVGSSYLEDSRGIKIDGGNVVHSGCKVIMTAKVFEENPQWTPRDLIGTLTTVFGGKDTKVMRIDKEYMPLADVSQKNINFHYICTCETAISETAVSHL